MLLAKKFFTSFITFLLIFSLSTSTAYAVLPDNKAENVIPDSVGTEIQVEAGSSSETNIIDEQDGVQEEEVTKLDALASDVIEYVYLDEKIVALGEEENVALAFFDETTKLASAQLVLQRSDTSETIEFDAVSTADSAALFTFAFHDEGDTANYRLLAMNYQTFDSSESRTVIFSSDNTVEGYYSFEVVTQQVKDAVSSSATESGEVSAFVIEETGNIVAADSISAAIEQADPEAASNIQEPGDTGISTLSASVNARSISSAREGYLIVGIDPGHGGYDSGAVGYGLAEKDVNWKIANAFASELSNYTGVSPVLLRSENECPGLQERVNRAVLCGADVFVSVHINASGAGTGTGAEVWVPNTASYLYEETHVVGSQLGEKILAQLTKLGLSNRGVKVRDCTNDERYPDGSLSDYYTVINAARNAGIPGIIVEHAFIDNASDAAKLSQDSFLTQLGQGDATGIALQYGLIKDRDAQSTALVKYSAHVSNLGWQVGVYDGKVSGTTGKNRGLEAFSLALQNQSFEGGIRYKAYVTGIGWQDWVSNSAPAGTMGQARSVQAMQLELTGQMAENYDVYYRVHSAYLGWLGWAKNGTSAGSVGYNYDMQAYEVVIVPKNGDAPGSTANSFYEKGANTILRYQTHVAKVGWQAVVGAGDIAGTTGYGYQIEALSMSFSEQKVSGSIEYNAHLAGIGWQGWRSDGAIAGTTGQNRQVEAIQIKLTAQLSETYDIYYRIHAKNFGWLDWASNGGSAGSAGYGYRIEAMQVVLVEKGMTPPGSTINPYQQALVSYQAHVADIGWQGSVLDGAIAGTSGQSKAIEALVVSLPVAQYSGGIESNSHVSNLGWQGWKPGGTISGTTGQGRKLEAIQIRLTGQMAENYDVYYRTHCQGFGWLDWASNGEKSGTAGFAYRMEAVQVVLVSKGGSAPGPTSRAYVERETPTTVGTSVMGYSQTNVDQMIRRYAASGKTYPSQVYAVYGASNIKQFCTILLEEANAEGVRAEVVFAQAMWETGWLQFGGDVMADQCNFAGIGATGGVPGNSFNDWGESSVRKGLRAQVQHLKAYASTDGLNTACVDPRFNYVLRGCAPTVEELGSKWASSPTYGTRLAEQVEYLLAS